ncbi:MAG TPA: NUDIX domain-containing protein [Clostridia bacterium]|nr:NUDIX domain-containing protein [Clostridia bacterium]
MNLDRSYGAVVVRRYQGDWNTILIKHKEGGHWSFPKGHARDGESIDEVIYRKVKDETGLKVEIDPVYSYRSKYILPEGRPKEVFYHLARPKTDQLKTSTEEIETMKWYTLAQAKEILTYKEDKVIISQLVDDLARATILEKAIDIALNAHAGQLDKSGQAYVLHPLRVMLSLSDETDRVCAVLHDVVEDSDITIGDLNDMGFSREVIDTINLLTRKEYESYEDYISRVLLSDRACRVKLMDIKDNMTRTPFDKGNPSYEERTARYTRARNRILSTLQDKRGLRD